MRTAVCTIISKNYLAAARVLMQGAAQYSPEADRVVLLVDALDGCFEPAQENFRLLPSSELEIPDSRWFHFKYTILELNTAAKPFLIEKLMMEGYEAVVYLDPDIQIHSPLDEVWHALESHNAVVTPHLDQPIEDDKYPSEIDILRTGAYNLGFIGLRRSPETMKFIRWWGKRMEQYCVVDLNGGLFVDQKWMDLLPGLLESTFVLRHPGFNVAYWNIHGRQIQRHGDGYRVNGEPLRFFHFSGYHPRQPERFSKHQNRFELSTLPEAARAICADYSKALVEAGYDETSKWAYAYGAFEDGRPIIDTGRRIWWEMPTIRSEVPDPFSVEGGKRIRAAWNEIIPDSSGMWSGLSRLGWWIYQARPEAKAIMPDPFGSDNLRVLRWLVEGVRIDWALPEEYFEPIRASIALYESYSGEKLPEEMRRQLTLGESHGLPAAATAIYKARKDLQWIFSDPAKKDRAAFLLWLMTFGRLEHYLSAGTMEALDREWSDAMSLMPAAEAAIFRTKYAVMKAATLWRGRQRAAEQRRRAQGIQTIALVRAARVDVGVLQGVNLVGYARAEMGVGESVRAAARAARGAGLKAALFGVEAHPLYRAADTSAGELSASLPFPVTVLHVNADQTFAVLSQLGNRMASTRHKVGFWAWELETFPERWIPAFDHVDEVWAPSNFCRQAIAEVSAKPVLRMPHAVEPLPEAVHSREELGIPASGFTVLFMFDALSVVARKNPIAAIEAFRRAFGDSEYVHLVLKVSHSKSSLDSIRQMREAASGARVTIIDRVMDRAEVGSLIQHSDCLLSLHRSEGFGLTLAEAMSAGKTVICTGYSGNMDFTLPGSAFPVEYSLVTVGEGNEPYDAGEVWAEPDKEHAAALLRQVSTDASLRARIGEEARKRIRRDFSPEAVGRLMRRRLEGIHRQLNEKS